MCLLVRAWGLQDAAGTVALLSHCKFTSVKESCLGEEGKAKKDPIYAQLLIKNTLLLYLFFF